MHSHLPRPDQPRNYLEFLHQQPVSSWVSKVDKVIAFCLIYDTDISFYFMHNKTHIPFIAKSQSKCHKISKPIYIFCIISCCTYNETFLCMKNVGRAEELRYDQFTLSRKSVGIFLKEVVQPQ